MRRWAVSAARQAGAGAREPGHLHAGWAGAFLAVGVVRDLDDGVQDDVDVEFRSLGPVRPMGAHAVVAQHGTDVLRNGQETQTGECVELLGRSGERPAGHRQEQPEPLVVTHRYEAVDVAAPERHPGEVRGDPLTPQHVEAECSAPYSIANMVRGGAAGPAGPTASAADRTDSPRPWNGRGTVSPGRKTADRSHPPSENTLDLFVPIRCRHDFLLTKVEGVAIHGEERGG